MLRLLRNPLLKASVVFSMVLMLGLFVTPTEVQASDDAGALLVTAIEFTPTQYLTGEDMLSVMATKVGEPFDVDNLRADLRAIYDLAIERHNKAVFWDIQADPVLDGNGVKVIIEPIEAPIAAGFAIDIDVISEDEFLKYFELKPGDVLDTMAIQRTLGTLLDETGYWFEVTGLELDQEGVVHMQLRAVRISSIALEGNEKTRDYVIEREIESKAGEPLNFKTINGDWRRVLQLRLFDEVEPVLEDEIGNPLQKRLVWRLVERKTGSAIFGAGYSSADGLGGYIEVADENLFGRGQYASLRWELASRKSSYDLSLYEPNIGGSRISAGFGVYNTRNSQVEDREGRKYDGHSVGGHVSLGKRFSDFLQASVRLRVDDTVQTFEDESVNEDRTRSILFRLAGDTTDHPFYPTEGMRFGLSTELARKFWDGDTHFTKYEGEWSTYHKVGSNDQVVAVRLMGGLSNDELPPQDLFRVGGADTVRGYNYGAMKGDKMVVGNAEYRFKVSDNVQGVVFADAGNAWEASAPVSLNELKGAVGVGLRFETPLGIMRLDYGIGAGEKGRVFFSIGPSF